MKKEKLAAVAVGVFGILLLTGLLLVGKVSDVVFCIMVTSLALLCLAIVCLPRLRELDLRNLRLTLDEIKQVKAEVEEVKDEIVEMYGGIENLRREPLVLDGDRMKALGLNGGHLTTGSAVMMYSAGCIKRERERLARIFVNHKSPNEIAQAILDNSLDEKVFKWNGPETPLDEEPKSVHERESQKPDR